VVRDTATHCGDERQTVRTFTLIRLILDLVAAGLLIAGLAYWWLDNTAHELIGAAMFILVVAHNVFNRRWYGRISKNRREARGRFVIVLNLSLLTVMLVLLATSVMVSRSLFGFLGIDAGFTVRELHILAAYWAVVLVGVHVGLNWQIVMNACRAAFSISGQSLFRAAVLRLAARLP
jgi:hypothetical protein